MEIPLITLLDRLKLRGLRAQAVDGTVRIRGIRLLTGRTARLQKGICYVGSSIPEQAVAEDGAVALLAAEPFVSPLRIVFADPHEDCCALFERAAELFEQFRDWDEKLRSAIYERRGLRALILLLSEIMGNAAYLVDSSFRVLAIDDAPILSEISAIWKHLVAYGYLSYDILSQLRSCGELKLLDACERAAVVKSRVFNNEFINYNLRYRGKIRGHLFIVGYFRKTTPGDLAYAEDLGTRIFAAMAEKIDDSAARGKDYENFLIHVLNGTLRDRELIARQLKPLGWEPGGRFCVARIKSEQDGELLAEELGCILENLRGGKPVLFEGCLAAVFPLGESDDLGKLEPQLRSILEKMRCAGGVSDDFDGFFRLRSHYLQASAALELGEMLGLSKGPLFCYREYAVMHLLNVRAADFDLDLVCDKAVFRLRDYDAVNHTEYRKTLEEFIRSERNIAVTAEKLFIHRNTLIYRVKRMVGMLRIDLDDDSTRARLAMSFFVLRYQEAVQSLPAEGAAPEAPAQPAGGFAASAGR